MNGGRGRDVTCSEEQRAAYGVRSYLSPAAKLYPCSSGTSEEQRAALSMRRARAYLQRWR